MSEKPLKCKVALVTGAGRGIGKAIATSLAAEGSKVVVNARNHEGGHAEATAREIREAGGRAIAHYADVTDFEQARKLTQAALDAFGKLDILVNNAGVTGWKMPWEMSEEDWDKVISVSLKGTFNCTRHACGFMKEQRCGRIINCTSESWISRAAACHYAAAKAGVVGFTRAVAIDLAPYGVTCNAYAPYAKTDISGPRTIALIETKYKLGKISREDYEWGINPPGPEGIGPLIAYLASDQASYINGKVFYASGGKIALFSEPVKVKTILKKLGIWSVQELAEEIPLFFK
jgi:NAD(P)-dependent dehydrogenase (short-subunit alcohol dehydrogenase family)